MLPLVDVNRRATRPDLRARQRPSSSASKRRPRGVALLPSTLIFSAHGTAFRGTGTRKNAWADCVLRSLHSRYATGLPNRSSEKQRYCPLPRTTKAVSSMRHDDPSKRAKRPSTLVLGQIVQPPMHDRRVGHGDPAPGHPRSQSAIAQLVRDLRVDTQLEGLLREPTAPIDSVACDTCGPPVRSQKVMRILGLERQCIRTQESRRNLLATYGAD